MGNLYTRVSEIMDKIYEDSVFSVDREEEIPSPGQIIGYIEQLETEQEKALAIVNDWFDNLED